MSELVLSPSPPPDGRGSPRLQLTTTRPSSPVDWSSSVAAPRCVSCPSRVCLLSNHGQPSILALHSATRCERTVFSFFEVWTLRREYPCGIYCGNYRPKMTEPSSKRSKMSSLAQLKKFTVVVADTGDFESTYSHHIVENE